MPNQGYTTVPNQRTITVHRQELEKDFLGIKNENWQYAARDLGPHGLRLYLYLAANADGYRFALSPAAIREAVGMPRSTYHDQFKVLEDKGYLIYKGGSSFDFYEVPIPKSERPSCAGNVYQNSPASDKPIPQSGNIVLPEDIEINNKSLPNSGIDNVDLSTIGDDELTPEEEELYLEFLKEHEEMAEEERRMEEEKKYPPTPLHTPPYDPNRPSFDF